MNTLHESRVGRHGVSSDVLFQLKNFHRLSPEDEGSDPHLKLIVITQNTPPGISTLSQSPMLGFHKQMDNRIKLLEEILSFRMQGVEFDNGDMYVDGHKAASDVRDEFVSVTEKLMDELAQCYNVPIHPLTSQ